MCLYMGPDYETVKNFQSYLHHKQHQSSYDCSCTSEGFIFLACNFCFFVFFVFVAFLHAVVNWGGGCFQSSEVDDEVEGSCLSWWVLPLAGTAAILEIAVSTVKCSSVSLKEENSEACCDSISLHFILNESVKAIRHNKFRIDNCKKKL